MSKDFGKSVVVVGSTSESLNSDHLNGPNSDLSFHGDMDADNAVDDDEDGGDYDDSDDYTYDDDDDDDENDYLSMQAKFDYVDLPPGVEALVPWLKDPAPCVNTQAGPSSQNIYAATSSSTVLNGVGATGNEQEEKEQEGKQYQVLINFHNFKRFDTVDDFSDHHYTSRFLGQQVSVVKITVCSFSLFVNLCS